MISQLRSQDQTQPHAPKLHPLPLPLSPRHSLPNREDRLSHPSVLNLNEHRRAPPALVPCLIVPLDKEMEGYQHGLISWMNDAPDIQNTLEVVDMTETMITGDHSRAMAVPTALSTENW